MFLTLLLTIFSDIESRVAIYLLAFPAVVRRHCCRSNEATSGRLGPMNAIVDEISLLYATND